MKRIITISALLASVIFLSTGCANETKKEVETTDTLKKDTVEHVAVVLQDTSAQSIYNNYIALKEALVKSDAKNAQVAANKLTVSLKQDAKFSKTVTLASDIAKSNDLAAQRKNFTGLSNDLISHFKKINPDKGTIYVQHCPMANNGDGGDWLSSEKKIQNPYYGDEMLECGAILESIGKAK